MHAFWCRSGIRWMRWSPITGKVGCGERSGAQTSTARSHHWSATPAGAVVISCPTGAWCGSQTTSSGTPGRLERTAAGCHNIYEEWTRQPSNVLADVLQFLDVEPVEMSSLPRVRSSRRIRNARLQRWLVAPPGSAPFVLRGRVGRRSRPLLTRMNISQQPGKSLDPALRQELTRWLEPEVARLSEVVGRDLSKVWELEHQ